MKLAILSPRKVLSKAYLRQTVVQKDIETFVTQLKRMFERLNEKESEENHKNLMSDFLKSVYYSPLSPMPPEKLFVAISSIFLFAVSGVVFD